MKRLHFIIFLTVIFFSCPLLATGPSYIYSEIRPISINEQGDVLCRTRFLKNDMGSHWYDLIEYGLCVLTDGKIIEFNTKKLDSKWIQVEGKTPDPNKISEQDYIKLQQYWDWLFDCSLNFEHLDGIEKQICNKYGFKESNVYKYKVDRVQLVSAFRREKKINLQNLKQQALRDAYSESFSDSDKINILYDFGSIVILHNQFDDDKVIGSEFSYTNPLFENVTDLKYDYFRITGVLFLNTKCELKE